MTGEPQQSNNPFDWKGLAYFVGSLFGAKINEITEDARRRRAGMPDGTAQGSGLSDDVGSQGHR